MLDLQEAVGVTKRVFRFAITGLALVIHLIALIQYRLEFSTRLVPERWLGQFNLLLLISVVLSMLLLLTKKKTVIWGIFLIKTVILVLISLPLGGHIGVDLTLLATLLVEAGVYFDLAESLCYNCALTLLLLYIRSRQVRVWNEVICGPSVHDLLFFFVYTGILIIVSAYLPYQEKHRYSATELNRRLEDATLQLADANLKLQEYAALVEQQTIQNERKRIAREMHDTVAYTLTNLVMMLDAGIGLAVTGSNSLLDHLSQIRLKAQEGLVETRRTLQALRPPKLAKVHGLHAIQQLVTVFANATKIKMTLNLGNAPLFFGEEIDWVVYRLVQEGITNSLRHGKASHITVSLAENEGNLVIQIKDNGLGNLEINEGFGLLGMRERVEKLGGKINFYSIPGNGFVINTQIPLQKGSVNDVQNTSSLS
jgi:signal transduction histidine kinase